MFDRIARAFGRSEAIRDVVLDISKGFKRVWHVDLLHKLRSYEISGQISGLISSFLSNKRLRVFLVGKPSKEYSINAEISQESLFWSYTFPTIHC